jgi:hypothetical protein
MTRDRLSSLMERTPEWVPRPELDLAGVRRRHRRRRRRRTAGGVAVVAVLAAGIGIPLSALSRVSPSTTTAATVPFTAYGIRLDLPPGWDSRAYVSPGVGPWLEVTDAELGNGPPPGSDVAALPYEYGGLRQGGSVYIALFEYPPRSDQPAQNPFTPTSLPFLLGSRGFRMCQDGAAACFRRPFSVAGRSFYLVGALATLRVPPSTDLVPPIVSAAVAVPRSVLEAANDVLGSLRIGAEGYDDGSPCGVGIAASNHRLVISGDRIQFASSCLSGIAPDERTTIEFLNTLRTVSGKPVAVPCSTFTIYRSAMPPRFERASQALFRTTKLSPPASWGKIVRFTVPGLPAGIHYFSCSGWIPGLQGVYVVEG